MLLFGAEQLCFPGYLAIYQSLALHCESLDVNMRMLIGCCVMAILFVT